MDKHQSQPMSNGHTDLLNSRSARLSQYSAVKDTPPLELAPISENCVATSCHETKCSTTSQQLYLPADTCDNTSSSLYPWADTCDSTSDIPSLYSGACCQLSTVSKACSVLVDPGDTVPPDRGGGPPSSTGVGWGRAQGPRRGWKVMGVQGLACSSLCPGPVLPALVLGSPVSRLYSPISWSTQTTIVLVLATALILLGNSPGTAGMSLHSQQQSCDFQPCWHLYINAVDFYQVSVEYDQSHNQMDPEQLLGKCVSSRTFYLCLDNLSKNKSSACKGDLRFHGAFDGIKANMKLINCSVHGQVFDSSMIPTKDGQMPQVCTYRPEGPPQMHYCSLFGEPHLRTFHGHFETCAIRGAWPLLDNRYLTVQVTSTDITSKQAGTVVTELTVMVKRQDDCAVDRFVTYQAQASLPLPTAFDDGSVHFGPEKSVQLQHESTNQHVNIYLRYINTTVVVRRYTSSGGLAFLTVGLLMPEKILNQSVSYVEDAPIRTLELCSQGCPDDEKIDYLGFLNRSGTGTHGPKVTDDRVDSHLFENNRNSIEHMVALLPREVAVEKCRQKQLIDFYLYSCVFDLMKTNQTVFSQAIKEALADMMWLYPQGNASLDHHKSLDDVLREKSQGPASSGGQSMRTLEYIHRTMFILLTVACAFICGGQCPL